MADLKRKQLNQPMYNHVRKIHEVTRDNAPLEYVEMKLIELEPGGNYQETLTDLEVCVVVLTGKATVKEGEHLLEHLGTRTSVFEKIPTDSVYISAGCSYEVTGETYGKVLLCYAPSDKKLPTCLIPASEVRVEHRGKNNNKRMVHNILTDESPIANSLLVVEVYTDSGNWSSYPPHKHDQNHFPEETFLEELYYHEMNPAQGFVFQRVYTDDRILDETMAVENGEVVLVPRGYHPVAVPDGYDSYYLNIMAGPIKAWKFHNEPDHAWLLERN